MAGLTQIPVCVFPDWVCSFASHHITSFGPSNFFLKKRFISLNEKSSKANMMPCFEAFCLEFIIMVDIEKVLYFQDSMSLENLNNYIQGSITNHQKISENGEIYKR